MAAETKRPRTPAQQKAAARMKARRVTPPDGPPVVENEGKLDRILNAIEGLAHRVDGLEARQVNFVQRKREKTGGEALAGTYQPPDVLKAQSLKGLRAGQAASGSIGPLDLPENIAKLPPQYRPIFRSGQLVRINPDALVWGTTAKRWVDVLSDRHSSGDGEVTAIQFMTKTWEPKYTVYVEGFTGKTGDGFRESELLPT